MILRTFPLDFAALAGFVGYVAVFRYVYGRLHDPQHTDCVLAITHDDCLCGLGGLFWPLWVPFYLLARPWFAFWAWCQALGQRHQKERRP